MKKTIRKGISLIVPAYECADRLPAHLKTVKQIRPYVREIIWVVTPGQDATLRLIVQAKKKLGGRLLETPRGLYAAWNSGIRHAKHEFTYISTVGEDIAPKGLIQMSRLLRKHKGDVCFSPPEILPATKKRLRRTRHWPIFRFALCLAQHNRKIVPAQILFGIQVLAGISGLLGSCASCLFRTKVLKLHPFPINFLHYGDTAWFYQNLCRLKFIYISEVFSTFHVHDLSNREVRKDHLTILLAKLASDFRKLQPSSLLPFLSERLIKDRNYLDTLREPHPYRFWWMNPIAWYWRVRRNLTESAILNILTRRHKEL